MKKGIDFFIDKDVYIKHKDKATFGNHVAIDKGFYCTTQLEIGDYVHLAPYTVIIGGKEAKLKMEHFSGIAAGGRIVCGGDNFTGGTLMNPQVPLEYRDPLVTTVIFKAFSCIGVNTVVMPGITLAEGSVVGSNSLLTTNTEPWTVYAGSPAKPIKKRKIGKIYEYAKALGYEVF